jgi:hypothetical protein
MDRWWRAETHVILEIERQESFRTHWGWMDWVGSQVETQSLVDILED